LKNKKKMANAEDTLLREIDVDENLTNYLNKEIPTKKRTYSETFNEDTESEEDDDAKIQCTKATRDEIYRVWTEAWDSKGEELLPLVQKLSKMSEQQAKAYLTCLKAVQSRIAHASLSKRMLTFISEYLCHPDDPLTPLAMQDDAYLNNGIQMFTSDILSALGKIGIVALLFIYGATSRYYHRKEHYEKNKRKTAEQPIPGSEIVTTRPAPETIQAIRGSERGDGQNNAND